MVEFSPLHALFINVRVQVAKKKRAHATYRNQLEFAAQPLSPRAWCGLVTERLEEWRRQHRTWAHPTPPTPATRSSHPHPPHTGTPLTKAQIVAASPKGTPLEQVAIVVMYRSRSPVELRSLTKCTQLSNLSLTKCGLASLSGLEGCSQLKEIKVQVYRMINIQTEYVQMLYTYVHFVCYCCTFS